MSLRTKRLLRAITNGGRFEPESTTIYTDTAIKIHKINEKLQSGAKGLERNVLLKEREMLMREATLHKDGEEIIITTITHKIWHAGAWIEVSTQSNYETIGGEK